MGSNRERRCATRGRPHDHTVSMQARARETRAARQPPSMCGNDGRALPCLTAGAAGAVQAGRQDRGHALRRLRPRQPRGAWCTDCLGVAHLCSTWGGGVLNGVGHAHHQGSLCARFAPPSHPRLTQAAHELGITVARVPTYSPHSVAEHAVALMFALNRCAPVGTLLGPSPRRCAPNAPQEAGGSDAPAALPPSEPHVPPRSPAHLACRAASCTLCTRGRCKVRASPFPCCHVAAAAPHSPSHCCPRRLHSDTCTQPPQVTTR